MASRPAKIAIACSVPAVLIAAAAAWALRDDGHVLGFLSREEASSPKPPESTIGQPAPRRQTYNYQPVPGLTSGMALRPMDYDILKRIEDGDYKRTDMLDLFPDRPYQVKMIGSPVEHWINAVLIDLDRDGKWDEKWAMKLESVTRHTMGKGEDDDKVPWALQPGRWLPY
jgi:hypothetical protein